MTESRTSSIPAMVDLFLGGRSPRPLTRSRSLPITGGDDHVVDTSAWTAYDAVSMTSQWIQQRNQSLVPAAAVVRRAHALLPVAPRHPRPDAGRLRDLVPP